MVVQLYISRKQTTGQGGLNQRPEPQECEVMEAASLLTFTSHTGLSSLSWLPQLPLKLRFLSFLEPKTAVATVGKNIC